MCEWARRCDSEWMDGCGDARMSARVVNGCGDVARVDGCGYGIVSEWMWRKCVCGKECLYRDVPSE
jgi:hypothetical protein